MIKKKEDDISRNLYSYLIAGYYLDDEANVNIDHLKNILSGEKMVGILFYLLFNNYIYLIISSKALLNDKLIRIVMPKFQESSVKKHYPSVKEHILFSKYWCATPKTWTPTFTYFWNVTFIHLIPLLINCLLFI